MGGGQVSVLSRNFEKNAYLALLMQEMEEKEEQSANGTRRWGAREEEALRRMVEAESRGWEEVLERFPRVREDELRARYEEAVGRARRESEGMEPE